MYLFVVQIDMTFKLFAILQKYEFSSKSQLVLIVMFRLVSCLRYCKSTSFQANHNCRGCMCHRCFVVCDTAKVRVFKQITTNMAAPARRRGLFAILQKYEFSSKSQQFFLVGRQGYRCLRYCKSTSFQANHNLFRILNFGICVVCDTAKVRVFKQITTAPQTILNIMWLFAILQKYEFSSKSQLY